MMEKKMSDELTIIITMAGVGSRFKKAGFSQPKYMISVKGKTLFQWSMDSLLDFNKLDTKYIFVVNKNDGARVFIEKNIKEYNIRNYTIVELIEQTDGQATSCFLALKECNECSPILIYNIDTYIEPYKLRLEDISGDGFIPCFYGEGDHWSFVKTDNQQNVIEVREKIRISNNCTIGAYYFKSANLYKDLYNEYYIKGGRYEMNERYIAPMYNLMLKRGDKVCICNIDSKFVHILGTPEELRIFELGYEK